MEKQIDDLVLTDRKVYTVEEIADLKKKGLTLKEIGQIVGCTKQAISQRLKAHGVEVERAERFVKDRVGLIQRTEKMILDSINPAVIAKAGLRDRMVSLGIALDKEFLLEGGIGKLIQNNTWVSIVSKSHAIPEKDITPPKVEEVEIDG